MHVFTKLEIFSISSKSKRKTELLSEYNDDNEETSSSGSSHIEENKSLSIFDKELIYPKNSPTNMKLTSEDKQEKEENQDQFSLEPFDDNDFNLEGKMLDVNTSFIVTELENTLSRLQSL